MAKIAYIYGRPGPHAFHRRLGEAVDADFVPVDFRLRWHDRPTWRPYRYLSWATCALSFPRRDEYDLFLSDGPHIPPLILKQLGLLRKNQRVAALMANEMLYFLKAGRYSMWSTRAIIEALSRFDALICLGDYQTRLAQELLSPQPRRPQILTAQEGIFDKVRAQLSGTTPRLDGRQLLFIGNCNGPSWGAWYKGVDLLLDTFKKVEPYVPGLTLKIVGDWDTSTQLRLRAQSGTTGPGVSFLGRLSEIHTALSESALYVHLGRGDAFPISVLEAMLAGVPTLVSDQTGTSEAVAKVDDRLVVPNGPAIAAERIRWYLSLDAQEKNRLSSSCRQIAESYIEGKSVRAFVTAIEHALCA